MINKRTLISCALIAIMILSVFVGTFALFTDRETTDTDATVGNVDIVLDYSNLIVDVNGTGEYLPGEAIPMTWSVYNNGSKSADVRTKLIISYFDEYGEPIDFNTSAPELLLYPAATDGSFDNSLAPHAYSLDGNVMTYVFENVLSGNDSLDVYENEPGCSSEINYMKHCYYYTEQYKAGFMTVDIVVEAKQYRNGYNVDWENIQSTQIVLSNGDVIDVTPEYD